ncbi:MAG: hypothetical protein ACO3PB_00635 [Miltoncostaeaceae bacterium]|jgi:hypothetical protein
MNFENNSLRRRGAVALAGLLAVGAIGFAGCGSSSSSSADTAAAEAALSADLQAAYADAEAAVTKAEDAVVGADNAAAAVAAWPALETELTAYEKTLADMEAGATGACLDAVKGYTAIEKQEHTALDAIYAAAMDDDPDDFAEAVKAYTDLATGADAKAADAALASACGVKVA